MSKPIYSDPTFELLSMEDDGTMEINITVKVIMPDLQTTESSIWLRLPGDWTKPATTVRKDLTWLSVVCEMTVEPSGTLSISFLKGGAPLFEARVTDYNIRPRVQLLEVMTRIIEDAARELQLPFNMVREAMTEAGGELERKLPDSKSYKTSVKVEKRPTHGGSMEVHCTILLNDTPVYSEGIRIGMLKAVANPSGLLMSIAYRAVNVLKGSDKGAYQAVDMDEIKTKLCQAYTALQETSVDLPPLRGVA